ncbi:MAG: flagellar biosynthesis protein FlgN [Treponema sp.]|jgi:hypothetical protein|nr:flagellar biosynthesis protein FlgN [Treponema sp.]
MVTTKPGNRAGNAENRGLSPEEIERRVAVLKRFRELLREQRGRFCQYLEALDKQKGAIESGGTGEDLLSHVELEEKIVADIFAIQKVINPLEEMYRAAFTPETAALKEEQEVPSLKRALEELKAEAVLRSRRNRTLLAKRMEGLRTELKTLRKNPYALHRSVYAGETVSLVDLRG